MIINNYNNTLPENIETELDFNPGASPLMFAKAFTFRLYPEEHLVIPYVVSDFHRSDYERQTYGSTFTLVAEIDIDSVPASDVIVKKQTTFAGDQVIDFGAVEDLGLNTLYGEHTVLLKCIQNTGASSITHCVHFYVQNHENDNNILDLNTTSSFSSGFVADGSTDGNTYTRIFATGVSSGSRIHVQNTVASYSVSVEDFYQGRLRIRIDVSGTVYTKTYKHNGGYEEKTENISGTYYVTEVSYLSVSRNTLSSYTTMNIDNVPSDVKHAALMNKIGLTRLFEAAKAYGCYKLRLPKMWIMLSYESSLTIGNTTYSGPDVAFPDEFVLDLNGSTIGVLQSKNIYKANLIHFECNTDTHICNGYLRGSHVGYAYPSTQSAAGKIEGLHTFGISGSRFCSAEDIDSAYAVGYDFGTDDNQVNLGHTSYAPKFDCYGYIDYDGNVVSNQVPAADMSESCACMMYTSSWGPSLAGFKLDQPAYMNLLCGTNVGIKKRDSFGCEWLGDVREVFVHFYDANDTFLKTIKVGIFYPIVFPYGAHHIRLSAFGESGYGRVASLNFSSTYGNFYTERRVLSVGCSYDRCKIHDTRTTAIGSSGNVVGIRDCYLWNISNGAGVTNLTKILIDFEDHPNHLHNCHITNCELIYGHTTQCNVNYGVAVTFGKTKQMTFYVGDRSFYFYINGCVTKFRKATSYRGKHPYVYVTNCSLPKVDAGGSTVGAAPQDVWFSNCSVYYFEPGVNSYSHLYNCETPTIT